MKIRYVSSTDGEHCHLCHRNKTELYELFKKGFILEEGLDEEKLMNRFVQNRFGKMYYFIDIGFFNREAGIILQEPDEFRDKLEKLLVEKDYPSIIKDEDLTSICDPFLRFIPYNNYLDARGKLRKRKIEDILKDLEEVICIVTRTYVCYYCSELLLTVNENGFAEKFRHSYLF